MKRLKEGNNELKSKIIDFLFREFPSAHHPAAVTTTTVLTIVAIQTNQNPYRLRDLRICSLFRS